MTKNLSEIILAIDPGLATVGFAAVEKRDRNLKILDFGVFQTSKTKNLAERLDEIARDFSEICEKFKPQILAIEKLIFVKNVTNGLAVAHARGVILQIAARESLRILEVLPKAVKMAVCGYGNAGKPQIQKMVQKIFKMENLPTPDDAADALAIAFFASKKFAIDDEIG